MHMQGKKFEQKERKEENDWVRGVKSRGKGLSVLLVNQSQIIHPTVSRGDPN